MAAQLEIGEIGPLVLTKKYRALRRRSLGIKLLRVIVPLGLISAIAAPLMINFLSARLTDELGLIGDAVMEIDRDKLTLVAPTIRGKLADDTFYVLQAAKIKRGLEAGSPVELDDLRINLTYPDGETALISSDFAEMDMGRSIIVTQDRLDYRDNSGMWGLFGRAKIDQKSNIFHTGEAFTLGTPNGSTIKGKSLDMNLATGIWVIKDVRMQIIQPEPETEQ